MNELLVRLLPKFDAVPRLFATYGSSLTALSDNNDAELTLRRFELALFEELGYEIQWHKDDLGREVSTDRNYLFAHDRGFVETAEGETAEVLTGADLMALNAWYRRSTPLANHARQSLKRVMRQAVDYRLDGRPLKVREALSQWRNLGQTAGEV